MAITHERELDSKDSLFIELDLKNSELAARRREIANLHREQSGLLLQLSTMQQQHDVDTAELQRMQQRMVSLVSKEGVEGLIDSLNLELSKLHESQADMQASITMHRSKPWLQIRLYHSRTY